MMSAYAEILANALEQDAFTQEKDKITEIGKQYDDIYCELLPKNEIPKDLFNLAMQFWEDWADASQHEWKYHESITKPDWPKKAIFQKVKGFIIKK